MKKLSTPGTKTWEKDFLKALESGKCKYRINKRCIEKAAEPLTGWNSRSDKLEHASQVFLYAHVSEVSYDN